MNQALLALACVPPGAVDSASFDAVTQAAPNFCFSGDEFDLHSSVGLCFAAPRASLIPGPQRAGGPGRAGARQNREEAQRLIARDGE